MILFTFNTKSLNIIMIFEPIRFQQTLHSICFSTAEWFIPFWNDPIPVWNESFQSGMNHSGVVPEIGYETYSQNSGSLYVSRIWRIFWSISIQCRAILNFPWFFFFDSLLWNDSFQSGKKHSRLEWILPDWNNIYWCSGEKPIMVLQWNVDIPRKR